MNQNNLALIIAVAGISGTLAGIIIGHFLTRSWERRKWLLDRRNEEFKELMTAVAAAFIKCGDPRYHLAQLTPDGVMEMNDASAQCLITIQNRIYIADQIKKLNLDEKWLNAYQDLLQFKRPERYGAVVREMMNSIVEVAKKHF